MVYFTGIYFNFIENSSLSKLNSWLTVIGRHFGQGSLSDRVVVFFTKDFKINKNM